MCGWVWRRRSGSAECASGLLKCVRWVADLREMGPGLQRQGPVRVLTEGRELARKDAGTRGKDGDVECRGRAKQERADIGRLWMCGSSEGDELESRGRWPCPRACLSASQKGRGGGEEAEKGVKKRRDCAMNGGRRGKGSAMG